MSSYEVSTDRCLVQGSQAWRRRAPVAAPAEAHAAFVEAARAGRMATPRLRRWLRVHRILDGAYKSARAGGVAVPVSRNHGRTSNTDDSQEE